MLITARETQLDSTRVCGVRMPAPEANHSEKSILFAKSSLIFSTWAVSEIDQKCVRECAAPLRG